MVILIAVVAILLTIIIALLLAVAVKSLDHAVIKSSTELESETRAYNPAVTLGHQIQVSGDKETQYKEARKLAAKQAAATPRGANVQIGPQYKKEQQATAYSGVDSDPITAVKIASHHGWDGVRTGIVAVDPAAAAAPAASPAAGGKVKLEPGKDYPVIEITDSMSSDEKRKARIANAKAKSAAMKAAKAAQQSGATVPVAAAGTAAVTDAAAPPPAAVAGISEPEYIEITDEMSPEEKRKARIANSKAKSAYKKALKAAGVDPSATAPVAAAPTAAAPTAAPQPAAVPVAEAAPAADAAAGIPKPELIEITDGMSPDEKRQARIANSKAKSAYNKALKAAGIDPKSVS